MTRLWYEMEGRQDTLECPVRNLRTTSRHCSHHNTIPLVHHKMFGRLPFWTICSLFFQLRGVSYWNSRTPLWTTVAISFVIVIVIITQQPPPPPRHHHHHQTINNIIRINEHHRSVIAIYKHRLFVQQPMYIHTRQPACAYTLVIGRRRPYWIEWLGTFTHIHQSATPKRKKTELNRTEADQSESIYQIGEMLCMVAAIVYHHDDPNPIAISCNYCQSRQSP